MSGVYCRDGPWIGEQGYGEIIQNEQTQGQVQQETTNEDNETRERETKWKKEKVVPFANAKRGSN